MYFLPKERPDTVNVICDAYIVTSSFLVWNTNIYISSMWIATHSYSSLSLLDLSKTNVRRKHVLAPYHCH